MASWWVTTSGTFSPSLQKDRVAYAPFRNNAGANWSRSAQQARAGQVVGCRLQKVKRVPVKTGTVLDAGSYPNGYVPVYEKEGKGTPA